LKQMAGFIPEHKIDEVRNAANIVEVISPYVNLKQAGRTFKGLCPFHAEKTPSFTVNPERQIFHCFGCGVGGNVFRFLMLQKNVSFPEAVEELAQQYGIDLPRYQAPRSGQPGESKSDLYRAVALAQQFFEGELAGPGGVNARNYLERRGFKPNIIREFHLGWAPDGWDNLRVYLESRGIRPQSMLAGGLIKPKQDGRSFYDCFRGRIIFPILDLAGKPVGFGGRLIKDEENQPKYLNSPETPIYQKGRLLYGLGRARASLKDTKSVIIVEGYLDLLALVSHGLDNVVATLGTALTPAHLRLLKGYVDEAVIVFDADEAGRAAAARALPLFMSADLEGRVLQLPDGHDPDSYVRAAGKDEFKKQMEQAVGLFDFFLEQTLARHPQTLAGKSRTAQAAMEVIAQVQGRTRQDLLRRTLAHKLDISEDALELPRRRTRPGLKPTDPNLNRKSVSGLATDFETAFLKLIILHPETWDTIFAANLAGLFAGDLTADVFIRMSNQYEQGGRIDLAKLTSEIKPEQVDLISGLALSEDGLAEDDLHLAVADYLNTFRTRGLKKQEEELSRRIKQAHEASDEIGLKRLLIERNRLIKEKIL